MIFVKRLFLGNCSVFSHYIFTDVLGIIWIKLHSLKTSAESSWGLFWWRSSIYWELLKTFWGTFGLFSYLDIYLSYFLRTVWFLMKFYTNILGNTLMVARLKAFLPYAWGCFEFCFLGRWVGGSTFSVFFYALFLLWLHLATVFVTIQQNVLRTQFWVF